LNANLIEASTQQPGRADPGSKPLFSPPQIAPAEKDLGRSALHGWLHLLDFCPLKFRRPCAFAISTCAVVAVGLSDWFAPPNSSFTIFYLVPVSFGAWHGGRRVGVFVAFLATLISLVVDQHFRAPIPPVLNAWNAFSRLAVYLFVTLLVAQLRDLTLNLEKLVEELTRQLHEETTQRLEVERQIAGISDREQERIGHELHDDLGQHLAGVSFRMKVLENDLATAGVPQAADAKELGGLVTEAIRHTRLLARRLDPVELENHDLVAALQSLASEIQRTYRVSCVLRVPAAAPELRVNRQAGLALFRICQEAVHNAINHGDAHSIEFAFSYRDSSLILIINDDGQGFSLPKAAADGQGGGGMGLRIMGVRAASIGGRLEINPGASAGVQVSCIVPLQKIAATPTPEKLA